MSPADAESPKAEILALIRSGQTTARLPEAESGLPEGLAIPAMSESDRILRFKEELDSLGVKCYVEETEKSVRELIRSLTKKRSVLSWNYEQLPYRLEDVLEECSVVLGDRPRNEQAEAEIGLTGCDAAIAETGSLVLISGPGKPRSASLLPFEHIAVFKRALLYTTMGEFFRLRGGDVVGATHVNIITGPSRTADIELSLTLGVHGPGRVTVVLGP